MQVGYDSLRKKLPLWAKHLLVATGVVVLLPVVVKFDAAPLKRYTVATAKPGKPDSRPIRLRNFLARLHCPIVDMAEDFIHAADDNHLDWRLLPSIAVIESSGGKAYKKNNIFGWDQGEASFPTIRAGLNEVAYKLGRAPLYRHQDSLGKLLMYNPNDDYADRVLAVMKQISPKDPVPSSAADKIAYRHREYVYATN
jgi:hypothetical protein